MRIIALGLGGAGCRIVNSLYAIDRRSSKVACVQGLAVDVDEETIKQLTALPENGRMCFSADAVIPDLAGAETPKAPIDINEIVSRVHNLETGENDAIILCCGLGGSMVDVAPHIIAGLRSSVVEPIFGLVTLPCLAEGERISGKAADDIEMLSSLLDGIIVFDNETWHKKIKTQRAGLPKKERGFAEKIGLVKSEKPLPPAQATYRNLNEAIVRRIGLVLRAGEFKADGGLDLAEVVLDSGEVLNTMKGMGFITIGYAVEKLPSDPLRFLSWLKPAGLSDEEQKKRASRIVELAKQAIYHEISTPCDLTSAHKALVLIAGPSHELSMKGFMTVRKWIDRSIAGLETRSGDYPVMSTNNVAIIIMLSGLENIPRITELREIRSQANPRKRAEPEKAPDGEIRQDHRVVRDDMITVPARMSRADDDDWKLQEREEMHSPGNDDILPEREPVGLSPEITTEPEEPVPPVIPDISQQIQPSVKVPAPQEIPTQAGHHQIPEEPALPRRRVIVAREEKERTYQNSSHTQVPYGGPRLGRITTPERSYPEQSDRHIGEVAPHPKETERQRIERELRRQRSMAIGGNPQKIPSPETRKSAEKAMDKQVIRKTSHQFRATADEQIPGQGDVPVGPPPEKRTIIIGKRKTVPTPFEEDTTASREKSGTVYPEDSDDDDANVEIKDRIFRARDNIFEGKGVRKSTLPPVRDSTLLHTDLRSKKKSSDKENTDTEGELAGTPDPDTQSLNKRTRPEKN
jgi:cell division GTPase FtsZ